MIVPMKKLSLLSLSAERKSTTKELEELGVVHVELVTGTSRELEELKQKEALYRKALSYLEQSSEKKKVSGTVEAYRGKADQYVQEVVRLGDGLRDLKENGDKTRKEIERLLPWGDFEPREIGEIREAGIPFSLVALNSNELKTLSDSIPYIPLRRAKSKVLLVWLAAENEIPEKAERFVLPEQSMSGLRAKLDQYLKETAELQKNLAAYNEVAELIESGLKVVQEEIAFAEVELSLSGEGPIAVMDGFIPESSVESVRQWASRRSLAIWIRDPLPDERVPTVLRNPKPIALLKPVLDFLGTLPGYNERDISPWFLLFLVIFLSMIIGDAVYGLLLLTLSAFVGIKSRLSKKAAPAFVKLLAVFGTSTAAWGAVTGTWLGLAWIPELPFFSALRIPFLVDPDLGSQNVQIVCFVLGLIHLNLAHLLRFIREITRKPHLHALAQIGWACVINGAFFLVLNVVVSAERFPVPDFVLGLIIGGMAMVFVFEQQQGDGFFRGILRGLGGVITTSLSGVSAFADVISYVRLFAVGLAGVAIEGSFNAMADPFFASGGFTVIFGIAIMFFGHSLNLVMGALSVIVHGIRLNMLEFSSHIGLEWTGFAYKPFGKKALRN